MRAHTITTMSRRRRRARRRAIALALAVCSLAIPASAGAYTDPGGGYSSANAITGGSEPSSQPAEGSGQSSLNAITQGSSGSSAPSSVQSAHRVDRGQPAYSSLNATTGPPASEPTVISGSPADTADGFDWGDAALGAGAAMALVMFGGAAFLTVRRRTPVSPSATTS